MSRTLLGLASLILTAAAACESTPADRPSGANVPGTTAVNPTNPVPGVTGPSVKVVIDGKDQRTAFCAQAHTGYGAPCDYEPGTRPDPPTKVFCGNVSNELNSPVLVISWGNPPPGYNGPTDPGHFSAFGQSPDESDKSLSGIIFDSSDTEPHLLNLNEQEITYSWMTDKNAPGHDSATAILCRSPRRDGRGI